MSGAPEPVRHRRRRHRRGRSFTAELPVIVVLALVISVLVKTFFVQAFYIPSGSMENTLLVNDRVVVNKLAKSIGTIGRGEIIVFRDPGGWLSAPLVPPPSGPLGLLRRGLEFVGLAPASTDEDLIKRVVGVGGDKVACCDSRGRVTVNGVALSEPYVFAGNKPSDIRFSVTVPKGSLWVMGDHRALSEDSRLHQSDGRDGMVPVADVIGRAIVIVWPVSRIKILHVPATFHSPALRRS